MKNRLLFLALSFIPFIGFTQENVEMADIMRTSGKIYVVVGVLLIIFLGIIGYLIFLDKRIKKIEKDLDIS